MGTYHQTYHLNCKKYKVNSKLLDKDTNNRIKVQKR